MQPHIDERIKEKINTIYANRAGEYGRTLKYYIEFKNYLAENKVFIMKINLYIRILVMLIKN
jgi:hypothetical protein